MRRRYLLTKQARRGSKVLEPTDRRQLLVERIGHVLTSVALLYMLAFAGGVILVIESGMFGGGAVQFDFVAFWAAAKLALAGNPVAAFDQAALREAQALVSTASTGEMYWFYPPAFQFFMLPFAFMPYWLGWLIFNLLAMSVFARSLWEPARAVWLGHNLLVAAPIVIVVFRLGQLSLLWSGGLVLALHAIARDRALVAGLLLALLSIKPQLGILIPVALIAGQHWRVLIWASFAALLLHGLPTILVGLEYWEAFFDQIHRTTASMAADSTRWDLMVTPYSFLRFFGMDHPAATVGQYAVTAALAAGIAGIWARRSARFDLAAGMLFLAVPIATPYAYYYELASCIPAAILLVRGGFGTGAADRVLLGLAVLGPAVFFVSTELAPLFAPILGLTFARVYFFARLAAPVAPGESVRSA